MSQETQERKRFFDAIINKAKVMGAPCPQSSNGDRNFIEVSKTCNGKKAVFQYTIRLNKPDAQVAIIVKDKAFCDRMEQYLRDHPLDPKYNMKLDRASEYGIRYIAPCNPPCLKLPQEQLKSIQDRLVAAMKYLADVFDLLCNQDD